MRYLYVAILAGAVVGLTPRGASAQGSVDGFGGLSLNRIGSFGSSSAPVDFGGRVAMDLHPHVQLVGEVGRIGNLLPTTSELLLSFTPIDVRVPAFYGEAGVRVIASPRSSVSPYVEGSAGFARLDFKIDGVSTIVSTASRLALSVVDRTDPIASVGGGVLVRRGPLVVDLGYRYKQILGSSMIDALVGPGQPLQAHQVRVGVGVRF